MELRHLRYLIAVAEERSFVAAAARLQLAQPSLSRQIRDLEREIGTELFIRESSGTRLTAAGEECVRTARQMLEDVRGALQHARLAENGLVGRCVLAAGRYPLWNGLLARIVEQAHNDYPGIDVVVQEYSAENQWQALADAQVDIAFGTAPSAESMQLAVETHSLDVLDSIVVAKTHPLASRQSVTLRDLAGETWIRYVPAIEDEATRSLQQVLTRPEDFDVIATLNLNGDYLSDALAAQVGGIGIAPGGNINYITGHAIFEATHGTAPKYANLDKVNPGSVVLSGEMMFRYLGWPGAADLIIKGLNGAIASRRVTYDFARLTEGATEIKCSEFGDNIIAHMQG